VKPDQHTLRRWLKLSNFLNIKFLSNKTLGIITSLLVIFVAVRMGFRLVT